jgi:hypothetical protein
MGQNKSSGVVWHHATVTREHHEALNGQAVCGGSPAFPGAGKSIMREIH